MATSRVFFSGLGEERRTAAVNLFPPRPQIHLISSRPSPTLIGLARHEAGWPGVDSTSRSKADRRVSLFISVSTIFNVKTQISCAARSRVNK